VTWDNKDSVPHTATADDNSFDTGTIEPGASGSATIKAAAGSGSISYHCTIHPWMKATLTLGAGGTNGSGSNNQTSTSSASGGQQNQTMRKTATVYTLVPPAASTSFGTEPEHKNDWVTTYHDIYGTRSSQQTIIGKDNVNQLQAKWIFHSDFPIESPALIVGDRAYAIDNAMRVFAIDMSNGSNLWMFDPGVAGQQSQQLPRGTFAHGITYDNGVIFAPTGANATVVALNATDGKLMWQSAAIGDPTLGYREPAPPIVWKNYVIAGSALGDEPPFGALQGRIVALNRTNGDVIWNMSTTAGAWVHGDNSTKNGGSMVWSGGSLDPHSGILYIPTGNSSPDFNDTGRPRPNNYTSSIIAVDVKSGHMLWATPFVTDDTHDWDTAWGTSIANVTALNSTSGLNSSEQLVMGQTKRGDLFALDSSNGKVVWNDTVGVKYNIDAKPSAQGSGTVWPGTQYGVEAYHANDNSTVYAAVSNMGFNFFVHGSSGNVVPAFDSIKNGVGNGTITAVDMATGKIKWVHPTDFPTWASPAVSNGVVFSGHITATGTPYSYNDFGAPSKTPLNPSGVVIALDKDTGKELWEFNVGAPLGVGGPSLGHGMLLVTTGSPAEVEANKGGDIVAFGLPSTSQTTTASK
jgi:glucose dehydrogenase